MTFTGHRFRDKQSIIPKQIIPDQEMGAGAGNRDARADVALPLKRAPAVKTPGNRRSKGTEHATAVGIMDQ